MRKLVALLLLAAPASAVDFDADIRPILEQRCFSCHGPEKREGGLRLSNAADARLGGDSGHAPVMAGKPEESELFLRITAADEDRMPPKGEPLNVEQIALIRAWIVQGADWGDAGAAGHTKHDHWAFNAPVPPAMPELNDSAWCRNPIDSFVLAKMEAEGVKPSPEAGSETLLRRLSLDLTGLPPTPAEIDAFLNDARPDAYEQLVERLLASPHYGERMATVWLDAARYADSNGFEKDRARSIWPWRDWVIDAFNRDLPYDRFVVEQLAGDLLPQATTEERIATGFLRNSMLNEEGGIDTEEFRYEAMVDRTATVGTVMLGLTLACAQCHTHKFDPITQREYFQFFSYLDNTDDVEMTLDDPIIALRRRGIETSIAEAEAALATKFPGDLAAAQATWEAGVKPKAVAWTIAQPVSMQSKNHVTFSVEDDGSIFVSGDNPNTDRYEIALRTEVENITAFRIEALPDPRLPNNGPGRGVIMSEGDFHLSEVALETAPWSSPDVLSPVTLEAPTQDYADGGKTAALALDGKLDTGWSIKGQNGQAHAAVFQLAQPVGGTGGTLLKLTLDQYYVHNHILGRFRISVTSAPRPVEASGLPAELEASLLLAEADRSEAQRAALKTWFLLHAPELAEDQKKIAELRASLPKPPTTLVLAERESPRVTHMRNRGVFLQPGAAVTPGVPAIFTPPPAGAPANRLTLARWIASDSNPLAARVAVNRIWQTVLGKGLVATPEDLGLRSAPPSHPELLDWLAIEFVRRGWSTKEMLRLIVNSATYRQSSRVSPEMLERDPQNDLLARAPRYRVDAEFVRDIHFAAAKVLSPKIGGPSVYPHVPEGLLSLVYPDPSGWPESQGEDRNRRGLYTFWKRTLPFPSATVFDAPGRDRACTFRSRLNTPLQALTLLNDKVLGEATTAMATEMCALAASGGDALGEAFRRCTGRMPDETERARLQAYLDQQRARTLVVSSLTKDKPKDYAAWFLLCRIILNLDETITRS